MPERTLRVEQPTHIASRNGERLAHDFEGVHTGIMDCNGGALGNRVLDLLPLQPTMANVLGRAAPAAHGERGIADGLAIDNLVHELLMAPFEALVGGLLGLLNDGIHARRALCGYGQ